MYSPMTHLNKKYEVIYLLELSGIALALAFMIAPNDNSVLAQQNITNPANTSGGSMAPTTQQQQNQYSMSTSLGSQNQNWTGSISLFSPIIDAFKSKIHITLNDATTSALNAVGGGSNASAVAAFIHPQRGFLVYDVFVLDPSNNIHRVIVDPGNGKLLSNQPMSLGDMMPMAHPPMGMINHGMGMTFPLPPPHRMTGDNGIGTMGPALFPPPGMMGPPPPPPSPLLPGMGMMGAQDDG